MQEIVLFQAAKQLFSSRNFHDISKYMYTSVYLPVCLQPSGPAGPQFQMYLHIWFFFFAFSSHLSSPSALFIFIFHSCSSLWIISSPSLCVFCLSLPSFFHLHGSNPSFLPCDSGLLGQSVSSSSHPGGEGPDKGQRHGAGFDGQGLQQRAQCWWDVAWCCNTSSIFHVPTAASTFILLNWNWKAGGRQQQNHRIELNLFIFQMWSF